MSSRRHKQRPKGILIEADGTETWLSAVVVRQFTEPPDAISTVPGLPDHVRGITVVGTELFPVVSLTRAATPRAVVVDDGEARAVLLIDRAKVGEVPKDTEVASLKALLEAYRG